MLRKLSLAALLTLLVAALVAPAGAQVFNPNLSSDYDTYYGAPQFQTWPVGYYVWVDESGLHVRWTSVPGQAHRFNGEMSVQGSILSFSPVYAERGGIGRRQPNVVAWDITNTGGGEGFDVVVSQDSSVSFITFIDGRPTQPQQIFLGRRGVHPQHHAFAIRFGNPGAGVPNPSQPVRQPFPGRVDGWPTYVAGQPRFTNIPSMGYALWFNNNRWHLRWTSRVGDRHASGMVSTDGRFTDVRKINIEEDDDLARTGGLIAWETSAQRKSRREIDGVDFTTTGRRLTFTLLVDGELVPASSIFIGNNGVRPQSNPFTLTR